MIKLLTQENCPQCIAVHKYLETGLKGAYDKDIEVVKREDNPEEFKRLVTEHEIMSTPALISPEGDVLRNVQISLVKPFLDKHTTIE